MYNLRVWHLMPEQSKSNNHTSKINVFYVSHDFFLRGGQKVDIFDTRGEIKSTLWPASRKMVLLALQWAIKCTLWPSSRKVSIMQLREKMYNLRVCNLMPEQSKSDNHTSKINVFYVTHDYFSTRALENGFIWPAECKKIDFLTR